MLDKLTILVLTHYNDRNAYMVLDYYRETEAKILIADSSENRLSYEEEFANARHLDCVGMVFKDKMEYAVRQIETPYAVLCADDDFISSAGLRSCIEFLETNPDYASAQGRYVSFKWSGELDDWVVSPAYGHAADLDVNDETAEGRMNQLMARYMHVFYSVHRSSALYDFFTKVHAHFVNGRLVELALALTSTICGKHKILPLFYGARDLRRSASSPVELEGLFEIAADPSKKVEYENFINVIARYYKEKSGKHLSECERGVKSALNLYLDRSGSRVRGARLKKRVRDMLRPLVPEFVLRRRRKILSRPRIDRETLSQWKEMKSLILKHGQPRPGWDDHENLYSQN